MDVLSSVLSSFKLRGGDGYHALLTAPWGIDFPERKDASPFYVLVRGAGMIESGGKQIYLSAGDLVMLPHGTAHVLKDAPASPTVPFWSLGFEFNNSCSTMVLRQGGDGGETVVLAGEFLFDKSHARPLLDGMDPVVHIHADNAAKQGSIELIIKMLVNEGRATEPGAFAARAELLKLLFINIVRYNMGGRGNNAAGCPRNPLSLMFDSGLRTLTEALHENPGHGWSVGEMASLAGMSRTKFIERFVEVAGTAPASYLTELRMTRAVEMLQHGEATLEEIAERSGYGSEAAFSTAFKREMGVAPGTYRKHVRKPEMPVLDM